MASTLPVFPKPEAANLSQYKARDVMTKKVVFVKRDTPLKEVAEVMGKHGISGVPVVENGGKVVGIISEKDFLFQMGAKYAKSLKKINRVPVIGSEKIHNLGYLYAIIPAGLGAIIMLIVALLVNNIPKSRRYPEFWF